MEVWERVMLQGITLDTISPGASRTAQLLFVVVHTGSIPPDGTSITLDTVDLARGASVSRTVVVRGP